MVMTMEETIKLIQKKQNLSDEKVKKEMEDLHNEIKDITFSDKSKEDVEKIKNEMVKRRFITQYRKLLGINAETFEGIFIGLTTPIDMVAKRRREAEKLFAEKPNEAIEKGITDSDGNPLRWVSEEQKAKLPGWAKDNLGKPLPKEDIQRLGIGLVSTKDGKTVPMNFRIRGKNTKTVVPPFVQLSFNGLALKSSTEELAKINDAGDLNIKTDKRLTDVEVIALFNKYFKDNIITLNQIESFVEKHQEFSRFAIMKVEVVSINPRPTSNNNTMINIADNTIDFLDVEGNVNPGVICFVPDFINVNFPEKSEIWVVGQPSITDRGVNIGVLGIYIPEMYKNLVPKVEKIESSTEESDW